MRVADGQGMMEYDSIEEARKRLGLGKTATLDEVKEAYRRVAREAHPDRGGDAKAMAEINRAYDTVIQYISGYRYSFRSEDVMEQNPDEKMWEAYRKNPRC